MINGRSLQIALPFLFAVAGWCQCTNSAIPGKFYEYYIVAQSGTCNGNTFTTLGSNPAINDFGLVGFMAYSTAFAGPALWVGDGHNHPAAAAINPNETGSSETYDSAVQLSSNLGNVQMVTKDSVSTTSPATTSIRVWNTSTPDSYHYVGRGGPHQQFGAVFPYPSINSKGDTAFTASDAVTPTVKYLVQVPAGGALVKTGVNVSVGEPMIDDNGDVLLYQNTSTPSGGYQIVLYSNLLSTSTIIASCDTCNGANNYFTSIDSAPGLSHDGNVIVFQGNLNLAGAMSLGTTAGPGIFAALNQGATGWFLTRITGLQVEVPNTGGNNDGFCDPGETCAPGAELGFNAAGQAIYFNPSGYGVGTRVAVTNLGLGNTGIFGDSFVVSFVGTPSEASRPNPVLRNGTPLFFSANQGLWTIRVDVEPLLPTPSTYAVHPRTAISVVQIGDKIGGNVVTSLSAYDDVANAAKDENNTVRTMRRGDHRVAFKVSTALGADMIVRANHLDSDQDGLLDHWETTGIDMDQDGVVDLNLPAMGADPNKRDLFLEFAWIADQPGLNYSFQPAPGVVSPANGQGAMAPLAAMFNAAPSLTGNDYGARIDGATPAAIPAGIALHIDGGPAFDKQGHPFSLNMGAGNLEGGGNIGLTGTSNAGLPDLIYFGQPGSINIPHLNTRAYQDIKDNYFGLMDKDGRELAYHYVVFGEFYDVYKDMGGAYEWQVASANSNTLTSASPLPPLPADTGTGTVGQGEVVKITSGTGAGQFGTIANVTGASTMLMERNWATTPDATSTFSIVSGSTGLAEVFFFQTNDNNSLPGNDQMITMGGFLSEPGGTANGVIANGCAQWRTVAHELGHTLGLRHGGIDHYQYKGTQYLSLMSYSWQLQCDTVSQVQSYSGATDPTFDDWANLQHNFSDSEMHLGNTLGTGFSSFPEMVDQLTATDYILQNGPLDTTPPAVSITSPKANANVGLTLPLAVTVNATDNVAVQSVTVSFDVNGDGVLASNETVTAKLSGTNTYKANFPALSGPTGVRTITAAAVDSSLNSTKTTINVNVVNPNPKPSLTTLMPSSATHGGSTFTLTINGTNFVSGCTAKWNGSALKTTFVSTGKVTATVPASDIATPGTASVTVVNPAPGGGPSNALTFTIN